MSLWLLSPCLLFAHAMQHGDRAVRTPFAPAGFTPIMPDSTKPHAAVSTTEPSTAQPAEGSPEVPEEPWEVFPEYPDVPEGADSAVTLVFPEAICPERLVFVLHQLGPDTWVRDHGEGPFSFAFPRCLPPPRSLTSLRLALYT